MKSLNRRRFAVSALVAGTIAVLAGCTPAAQSGSSATSGSGSTTASTAGSASGSSAASTSDGTDVTVPDISASSSSTGSTTSTTTSTSSTPTIQPVNWTLDPAPGAASVSPLGPVNLTVANGLLQSVTVANADGDQITGAVSADGLSWSLAQELGYGRTYDVSATAVDAAGQPSTQTYQFTTLTPDNKTLATAFPTDGITVGVGQPIAIFFDEPIANKAAVQQMISVTTSTPVEGAFYWLNDKEVHWRPREYWPAHTHVDVAVMIYGKDVGNGVYGQQDKTFSFDIGASKIAYIDDDTHTMVIKFDGADVATIPVSLGRNKYPTYNGIHVVAEKYESKIMDSSTWGLVGTGAYRTEVSWATRISSSGEFVHAAPWSVGSQGYENVSHGCVNVSTDWAKWFYDNFTYGDVVQIYNTVGPPLEVWDGYGDWNVPWDQYAQGGGV